MTLIVILVIGLAMTAYALGFIRSDSGRNNGK